VLQTANHSYTRAVCYSNLGVLMMSAVSANPHVASSENTEEQKMKALIKHCQSFKGAEAWRSLFQLITTSVMYFALTGAMLYAYAHQAYWFVALGMLPAAGLLVRLFIFQHDCGHGSFFNQAWANTLVGRLIGILTFTPYQFWKKAHNMHHATSGNLSRRSAGAIDTLTVKEFAQLSPAKQRLYRIFRHPLVVLVFGPPFHVFVMQRLLPVQQIPFLKDYHPMPVAQSWQSIMSFNVALVVVYGLMGYLVGWGALFIAYLPIVVITAWAGAGSFSFSTNTKTATGSLIRNGIITPPRCMAAAIMFCPNGCNGSPAISALHHIHHFCALIPNYKLQPCLDSNPELQNVNRLTFLSSLKCMHLTLWDEVRGRMVTFREAQAVA
jgi:omega-6 fatty acid desaturase (delta-12 desaturase)